MHCNKKLRYFQPMTHDFSQFPESVDITVLASQVLVKSVQL
jgi:hypothetical protein